MYRLHDGEYAGWRLRDVWRHDPNALVRVLGMPTTRVRDTAAIKLFLMLLGGILYRSPEERLLAASTLADEAYRNETHETLVA